MGNITATMPLDIFVKVEIVENINIGVSCSIDEIRIYTHLSKEFRDIFSWSYEEMPYIDPTIVVHEILTNPGAKAIRQWLCLVHPRKVAAIESEV